jgi:hypothetical protein
MMQQDSSSADGEDIPKEAEVMARLLANLSGRSVAGFFPDAVADLSLEQMLANPSLVPPLNIDLQLALFNDPHAVAQTILAAVIRSSQVEREWILVEMGGRELDRAGFYSYVLGLLQSQWVTAGTVSIDAIQQLVPEYGMLTRSQPPEEWELRDYYFTWFQILNLRPTQDQIEEALRRLPIQSDSAEAPRGDGA